MNSRPAAERWHCPDWPARAALSGLAAAGLMFAFRGLLSACVSRWISEPQYSHGFVIPILAAGLIWLRRDRIPAGVARSSVRGLMLILVAAACHWLAAWYYLEALDSVGFLAAVSGVVLLIWGRRCFTGLWSAILFLGFMLPLPWQLEHLLSDPLQLFGAAQAAWCIQTCGIPAIAQGNTILMSDTQLGVAEACSGLRMLMVFAAISAAVVMISHRTLWEKFLVVASAVPIALICNIARIVGTAVAHHVAGRQTADLIFHDLSGWLMMPLALLLMLLELKLIDWLFVIPVQARPALTMHGVAPIFAVRQPGDAR